MLVLTIVMVGTVALGATFSDVKGTKYQSSVELLTNLKIVNGKTTTSFAPNDIVKRSEMAKMLVVALGKDADATKAKGKTKFSDVGEEHWASGYINIATQEGIIKGYPDGTFAPDDTVSYVESIAMLLRALKHEDVDKLSWPTGYVDKAKAIKLTNGVEMDNENSGAIRGNVSILLCNTLMSSVREVVASNNNGLVYGDGDALINKTFSNYKYLENGQITDIDFENCIIRCFGKGKKERIVPIGEYVIFYVQKYLEKRSLLLKNSEITVTDAKSKRHTFKYNDKDIYELYGKDVTLLYDDKNNEFIAFDIASNNKTVKGSVTNVTSKKIYIKKVEYTLPSSSKIKLVGISDIDDAEEAYLTVKDDEVTHVIAVGEEELSYGLATAKSSKSGNEYKVNLLGLDGEEKTYTLASSSTSIKEGEVVAYVLDKYDELVVKYHKDVDDAYAVESSSKTSLKLKGKTSYSLSTTTDVIIAVEDGEIYEMNSGTSIEEGYDAALVIELLNSKNIIVFVGGAEEIESGTVKDENASATKSAAKKRLKAAITLASKKSEASYSIKTYERMLEELDDAESVNQSTASIATMDKASLALENAISNLAKATTTDKNIRAAYKELQTKIKNAEAIVKAEYTAETYAKLTTAITNAKKIKKVSTTVAKIQTQIENLQTALDGLQSNVAAEQLAEMKREIDALIVKAEAKSKNDYTTATWNDLQEALTAAKAVDYTKMSLIKLTNVSNNLYTALENLISNNQVNFETAVKNYKDEKSKATALEEDKYTSQTWAKVEECLIDVDAKYEDIVEAQYSSATAEVNELIEKLKDAVSALMETPEYRAKEQLKDTITYAKRVTSDSWDATAQGITFTEFETKVKEAETVLNNKNATKEEISAIDELLQGYIY